MTPIIFGIQFYFATKPASPANAHAFAGDAGLWQQSCPLTPDGSAAALRADSQRLPDHRISGHWMDAERLSNGP
jgi:hypothetical protein